MSQLKIVTIQSREISDWDTFHDVDWMASVDLPDDEMSKATVAKAGTLVLRIEDFSEFNKRCPELCNAMVERTAFVNFRGVEVG